MDWSSADNEKGVSAGQREWRAATQATLAEVGQKERRQPAADA